MVSAVVVNSPKPRPSPLWTDAVVVAEDDVVTGLGVIPDYDAGDRIAVNNVTHDQDIVTSILYNQKDKHTRMFLFR